MKSTIQAPALIVLLSLAACANEAPRALGTLEYDRITLPAPAAERIVAIHVREGQRVAVGAKLLTLDRARTLAQVDAAQAEVARQREALRELETGPRDEQIAQARGNLTAAQSQAREADAYYARLRPLGARKLVAAAEIDRARAASASADAQASTAQAALNELRNGTRQERIAQAVAAVRAAQAQAMAQQITLEKLDIVVPRAGRIDSLPYRLGDQAPVGAPLAVLLVGETPYVRTYVPETIRASVHVGDRVQVFVDGRNAALTGRVRMVRSEPSFTPYFALVGKDAARLSYLAEISLDRSAAQMPAGLPASVEFIGSGRVMR